MRTVAAGTLGLCLITGMAGAAPRLSRGAEVFQECANCHTLQEGGGTKYGPNLHGILGRRIASMPDFDYSPAMQAEGGVWTLRKLNRFLARPQMAVQGTHMTFKGVLSPHDREDLLAWLAAVQKGDAPEPSLSLVSQVLAKGDPARGQRLFRPCKVCHSYEDGKPNKIGPNLHDVVGRPVASVPGFIYSKRLMDRGGYWTPETLNGFMTERKAFAQGSHLAFKKLGKPADRADLIAYLRKISPDYRGFEDADNDGPTNTRR